MLKLLSLTAALSTFAISSQVYLQNSVVAQEVNSRCYITTQSGQTINLDSLCSGKRQDLSKLQQESTDEEPRVEFAELRILGDYASGRITNLSKQNISIERINIVVNDRTAQIVANLYLKPGQSTNLRKALVVGGSVRGGSVTDVVSWLDENLYGYHKNFSVCKYFSYIETEKMCTYK